MESHPQEISDLFTVLPVNRETTVLGSIKGLLTRNRIKKLLVWLRDRPCVIFALWALWLCAPYFILGPMSYVRVHDNANSWLPAKLALSHFGGLFQFWDQYGGCGTDRLAAWGYRLFDVFFWMLPGWVAYALVMWLQRFVGGYFTYRLLRDFPCTALPALYAALTYALFSQPAINLSWAGVTLYDGFGSCGLPFCLWVLQRAKPSLNVGCFTAFASGILFALMCHYSMSLFILPAIPLWFIVIAPRKTSKFWITVALFFFGWACAALIDLVPAFLNSPFSHRAYWVLDSPLRHGLRFNALFITDIMFDNKVSLCLIGLALFTSRGRNRPFLRFLACGIGCCLFLLIYPALQPQIVSRLGFLKGFQLDRIYLIIPFLILSGCAIGLTGISKRWQLSLKAPDRTYSTNLVTIVLIIAILFSIGKSTIVDRDIIGQLRRGATFAELYDRPDLKQLAATQVAQAPFRIASIADPYEKDPSVSFEPADAWAYGLESADGYIMLYPQRFHSYWEEVIRPLMSNDKAVYNFFHYWGNCAYLFSPSAGFDKQKDIDFHQYYRLNLLSLANVRYIISPQTVEHSSLRLLPSRHRQEQLQSITWPLRRKILGYFRDNYFGPPLYIYENLECLPRFFVTGNSRIMENDQEVLHTLGESSIAQLRSTAYFAQADIPKTDIPATGSLGVSEVDVISYSSDRIVLRTTTDSPAILVNSTSYNPYWRAMIDGIVCRLVPVDHAFQAVFLSAGSHQVIFEYAPSYSTRVSTKTTYTACSVIIPN